MSDSKIREVINEPLSAVAFVQDYVELHFDGKIIRVFGGLRVESKDQTIGAGDVGWRDALCNLIGNCVRNLKFINDMSTGLVVSFDNDTDLIADLSVNERTGPEVLHYVPGDNEPAEFW
jgi:hypothetical protein